jgi:hypothetical protein
LILLYLNFHLLSKKFHHILLCQLTVTVAKYHQKLILLFEFQQPAKSILCCILNFHLLSKQIRHILLLLLLLLLVYRPPIASPAVCIPAPPAKCIFLLFLNFHLAPKLNHYILLLLLMLVQPLAVVLIHQKLNLLFEFLLLLSFLYLAVVKFPPADQVKPEYSSVALIGYQEQL